jgi:hypothetical protein
MLHLATAFRNAMIGAPGKWLLEDFGDEITTFFGVRDASPPHCLHAFIADLDLSHGAMNSASRRASPEPSIASSLNNVVAIIYRQRDIARKNPQ